MLARHAGFIDCDLHTLGEFVIGREHHGDVGIGRDDGACLVGDRIGDRIVQRAEHRLFLDARILVLELLPGLVAAVERRDAGDIDITCGPAFAIVLDGLFNASRARSRSDCSTCGILSFSTLTSKATTLMPASTARWAASFIDSVRPCWMMMPLNAKRDGLVDHVGLKRCILAAVKHAQIDAERLGLCFHARKIGLEEVAGRKIADERDLHLARLVKGLGHVSGECSASQRRCCHQSKSDLA
jgi:hypothetical protein